MKKTTVSILAVWLTAVFNLSFGRNDADSSLQEEPLYIRTLVINADVDVILVNNDEATLEATGNNPFKKYVRLWKTGDTLVIQAIKPKSNFEGTIYVPATNIRKIHVNSKAHVRSLFALQIPNLDVVINGACDFSVSNIGEITITGSENYSFEADRHVRRLPSGFPRRKE
jgi:hypothetical protein